MKKLDKSNRFIFKKKRKNFILTLSNHSILSMTLTDKIFDRKKFERLSPKSGEWREVTFQPT